MKGLALSAMAPTFLTYLTVVLKNTNVDFTKVIAQLTLSVRAISNVALRIVNWHPISQVLLNIGRNSTVAIMVSQSGIKIADLSISILFLFFCLEQRSLSCHVPNLDDLTVKKCEQADAPCMIKTIGKSILTHFTRVLCMEWGKNYISPKIFYQQAIAMSVQHRWKIPVDIHSMIL